LLGGIVGASDAEEAGEFASGHGLGKKSSDGPSVVSGEVTVLARIWSTCFLTMCPLRKPKYKV